MSYVFLQADGSGGRWPDTPAITGFPGGNVINHAAMATSRKKVGRCMIVIGSTTNDGRYEIIGSPSTTQTLVAPAPTVEAAVGYVQVFRDSVTKHAAVAITGFGATAGQVDAATANFTPFASAVHENDRCYIIGSTSNDGAWWVDSVPSPTSLIVRPLNGQAAIVAEAVPGGTTIQVVAGSHELVVTDEAAPWFLLAFAFGTVDAAFGSGANAGVFIDYSWQDTVNFCGIKGLGMIRLHQTGAGSSTWNIANEIVVNRQTKYQPIVLSATYDASPGISIFRLGATGGADIYDMKNSGAVIGIQFGQQNDPHWAQTVQNLKIESYASLWRGRSDGLTTHPPNSIIRGSIFSGTQQYLSGDIESVVEWTTSAGPVWAGAPTAANYLYTDSVTFGGALVTNTIEGLLKSAATQSPLIAVFAGTTTLKNPRDDYTAAQIFQGSIGEIVYTWNPTFVERDATGGVGNPIAGLKVRTIRKREDLGADFEPVTSPYTTDANGQINGGAGEVLLRDHTTIGKCYWEMIIEGGNYRAQKFAITMRAKLDYDHPVDVQQTDWEGELSR